MTWISFQNAAVLRLGLFLYSFSATFFIEMWKRRTAEIEYDWDVADFEEEVYI